METFVSSLDVEGVMSYVVYCVNFLGQITREIRK